jgi:O-methyltransferase domain/Dimerisation domain
MSSQASPSLTASNQTQPAQEPAQHLFQIATGYMPAACLSAAISLNIADHLADGPKSVKELARTTATNEQALYRVLRALASVGLFSEVGLHYFANTAATELLRSSGPGSVRDMVAWMTDDFHFRVWGEMLHSATSGQPAVEKIYGKPCFEAIPDLPDVAERFNRAMTSLSAIIVPAVLETYDFSGIGTLVDVAGGRGFAITSILNRYPEMRGVLFEMPYMLDSAHEFVVQTGVRGRCEIIAGDFFGSIVGGGDAYYLQHIIHDWNDEKALLILKNVREAIGDNRNGRVLIVDSIVQPANAPDFAKMLDLEMLLMPGGRERTEEEFAELLKAAGFQLNRVLPTKSGKCVIEGVVA